MSGFKQLVAVGDVIPTSSFPENWRPFGADSFLYGCLEMPLTERGEPWDKLVTFRADPGLTHDLADAGFNLLSLANNQVMNFGRIGLSDTIDALDAAGIPHIGAGPDLRSAVAPHVIEIDGTRIAVAALTCVAPRNWNAGPQQSGMVVLRPQMSIETDLQWASEEPGIPPTVHTWLDENQLEIATSLVGEARKAADLVIICVHWGVGSSHEPTGYQRQLGHALIDAGASVVLGSHSPHLQGFEKFGNGFISYGLGTFIRQQPQTGLTDKLNAVYSRMPRETAFLELSIANGKFDTAIMRPAQIGRDGIARPVDGEIARRIIRIILDRSSGYGIGSVPDFGKEPEILTWSL